MSRVKPPDDIEIASLRKKQRTVFDPMFAGLGTPWEDRATHGTIGAFFKTALAGCFGITKLEKSIRRPETITDARGYLIGISVIWALAAMWRFAYWVWRESKLPDADQVNTVNTAILGAIILAGAAGGTFVMFKVFNIIYGKLTAQEKDSVLLPDVLLYNVIAYTLGPSLLALLPYGEYAAMAWIFINLISAGTNRLRLRVSASVIDALISLLVVLAIVSGVYFVGSWGIIGKLGALQPVDKVDQGAGPSIPGGAAAKP